MRTPHKIQWQVTKLMAIFDVKKDYGWLPRDPGRTLINVQIQGHMGKSYQHLRNTSPEKACFLSQYPWSSQTVVLLGVSCYTTKTLDPTLIPGVIMLDICVNNVTSATIAPTVSNAGVLHRPQDQLLAKDHSGFPWRHVRRKQTNL